MLELTLLLQVFGGLRPTGARAESREAEYSQSYKEMDAPVLPGEEAGSAEVGDDHGQQVLRERGEPDMSPELTRTRTGCWGLGLWAVATQCSLATARGLSEGSWGSQGSGGAGSRGRGPRSSGTPTRVATSGLA